MALKPCRECGKEVSTEAKACPHCGAINPTLPAGATVSTKAGCLTVLIAIPIMWWGISSLMNGDAPACSSDYTLCKDNADLVNNYQGIAGATVACQDAVNSRARYGDPKWPFAPFGTFLKGDDYVKTGVVNLIDKDVQIPNVFGGVVKSTAFCSYDLTHKKVVAVYIDAPSVDLSAR